MKRKKYFIIIAGLILLHLLATPLIACKGRVLTLAVGNSVDQAIMGQMMSITGLSIPGISHQITQAGEGSGTMSSH